MSAWDGIVGFVGSGINAMGLWPMIIVSLVIVGLAAICVGFSIAHFCLWMQRNRVRPIARNLERDSTIESNERHSPLYYESNYLQNRPHILRETMSEAIIRPVETELVTTRSQSV